MNCRLSIITVALFCVIGQIVVATEIRHTEIDGNHLIEVGSSNFVLFGPEISKHKWKTVSVNGNHVIFEPVKNCKAFTELKDRMNKRTRKQIFERRESLLKVSSYQGTYTRTVYKSGCEPSSIVIGGGYSSTIQDNGVTFQATRSGFSVSSERMPGQLEHLFVFGDIITFVYRRGKVRAYSESCLDNEQRRYVVEMKATGNRLGLKFDSDKNSSDGDQQDDR